MFSKMKKISKIALSTLLVGSLITPISVFANSKDNTVDYKVETLKKNKKNENKLNISYIYDSETKYMIQEVDETNNTLDIVLPSFLEVKSNGQLKVKEIDKKFIDEMHKRNVKVVPYVSNQWVRSIGHAGMDNKEQLSTQIAEVIKKYNFDGVDIDIENLDDTYKEEQTEFMKMLREKLPKDKLLTLAIAANPTDLDTGWHGSYEYKKLEPYVDYFFLMTYDERTVGSGSGPTASYQFVEDSVKHLINVEKISKNKIVLGLPFYGRYWKYDGSEVGGQAITNTFAETLRQRYGATKQWDDNYKTPYTIFPIAEGATLNGQTLTGGNYVFWYEDTRSYIYKNRLVAKYDLKGYGSWNLNMADDTQWSILEEWANGEHYYFDMINHTYEKEVTYTAVHGWFDDNEDNFNPNQVLTRGDVAFTLNESTNIQSISILYPNVNVFNHSSLLEAIFNYKTQFISKLKSYNESITQDEVVKILSSNGYNVDKSLLDSNKELTKLELARILYSIYQK